MKNIQYLQQAKVIISEEGMATSMPVFLGIADDGEPKLMCWEKINGFVDIPIKSVVIFDE